MTQDSRHRSQTGDGKRTAEQSPAAGGLQSMGSKAELGAGDDEGAERKPRASKKKKKR